MELQTMEYRLDPVRHLRQASKQVELLLSIDNLPACFTRAIKKDVAIDEIIENLQAYKKELKNANS